MCTRPVTKSHRFGVATDRVEKTNVSPTSRRPGRVPFHTKTNGNALQEPLWWTDTGVWSSALDRFLLIRRTRGVVERYANSNGIGETTCAKYEIGGVPLVR